jgi:hypothetical protein
MSNSAKPRWLNDDARAFIWPYQKYREDLLFQNDYIAEYLLAAAPIAYRLLYSGIASFADPRTLSKMLPYIGLLVLLSMVGLCANRLGGKVSAWAAIAFVLSSNLYLGHMAGGLPRSFAFPLMSVGFAALVFGRPYWLASITVISAGFYFSTGAMLGMCLAILLLIMPKRERGFAEEWSLGKRCAVVTTTALLSALVVLPVMVQLKPYDRVLRPADVAEYPETGAGGRLTPRDSPPYKKFHTEALLATGHAFINTSRPWLEQIRTWFGHETIPQPLLLYLMILFLPLGLIGTVGYLVLVRKDIAARRSLIFPVAAFVCYMIAKVFSPYLYLPGRYVRFSIPILLTIVFPSAVTALAGLVGRRIGRPWIKPIGGLLVCGLCLIALGGRVSSTAGLTVRLKESDRIYDYLMTVPHNAIIAGWPNEVIDNVPYLSLRRALVSFEVHNVFHEGFVIEMRRRMNALINAYFATEVAPLLRLHHEFGVTHLIVDKTHYGGNAPTYFKPFDRRIMQARAELGKRQAETLRQIAYAAVFSDNDLVVLDLSRLRVDVH